MTVYSARPGQTSFGTAIGIVLLDNYAPYIPGDVANASTFDFPVRYETPPGVRGQDLFLHDTGLKDAVLDAARRLVRQGGVRAVTGACGFMLLFQEFLAENLEVPVFMSSLLQLPFMESMLGKDEKIGILTASSDGMDPAILKKAGVNNPGAVVIQGMQETKYFGDAIIRETADLDSGKVEAETVESAMDMVRKDPQIKMILSECSCLPPYSAAVQAATGLPVFDFVTMIRFVHSTLVRRPYSGHM